MSNVQHIVIYTPLENALLNSELSVYFFPLIVSLVLFVASYMFLDHYSRFLVTGNLGKIYRKFRNSGCVVISGLLACLIFYKMI